MRARLGIGGSVLAAAAVCAVTLVTAQVSAGGAASTFTGQCHFSGRVSFDPPLTNAPQSVSQRAVASGLCSGTFIDSRGNTHQLSDTAARFSETSQAENASCLGGTATGEALLRFPYGKIGADFQEVRGGGGAVIQLTGNVSGSAAGTATISQSEDPADILQRCASSGLAAVAIDADAATTPTISG
jgi:hypothetical protein